MKKIQKYLMLLLLAAIGFAFTNCSNDDEPSVNSLAGTSWLILSDSGIEASAGTVITFGKDGSLIFPTTIDGWDWEHAKWSVSNKKLKIVFELDEIFEGTFVVNDDRATFTYYWYDYDGKWFDEEPYIMTLQKI